MTMLSICLKTQMAWSLEYSHNGKKNKTCTTSLQLINMVTVTVF